MEIKPRTAALHILALAGLALAQPVYDILGQNAEYFLIRPFKAVDLVPFVAALSLGVPLALFLLTRLPVRRRLVAAAHLGLVGVLLTLLALPACNRVGALGNASGWGTLTAAGLAGGVGVALYARYAALRTLVTYLSASAVILPAWFLWRSDVLRQLGERQPAALAIGPIQQQTPVVLIIFDELPLSTLLDERRQIDPVRFPNFAALAGDATWFRNATTVHQNTLYAVPAMLTGNPAGRETFGGLADHPRNLFTLLQDAYDFRVCESFTRMCPIERRWQAPPAPGWRRRLGPVAADVGLLQLHLLTPRAWVARLPDVAALDVPQCCSSANVRLPRGRHFEQFVNALEPTERPALYFIHNVNPHQPHSNFPSGRQYSLEEGKPEGVDRRTHEWGNDEQLVFQAYQRHILQTGRVDVLLGQALDRLKARGIYDEALVLVVADHGVSYWPGTAIRKVHGPNTADIMRVPFLVKKPRQRQGVVDDSNVQIVDVLPTIADVQGFTIPWETAGVSAFAPPERKARGKRIDRYNSRYSGAPELELDADLGGDFGSVERKIARFGTGPMERVFAFGCRPELHGQPCADWLGAGTSEVRVDLDRRRAEELTRANFVPAFFKGTVHLAAATGDRELAVAVNGIVQTTVPVRNRGDGTGRLVTLVPEDCCVSSRNLVEFYVIETHNGRPRLLPTSSRLYVPDELPTQRSVRLASRTLTPRAVQGALGDVRAEKDQLVFTGWAADLKNEQLVKSVLVFLNGELVAEQFTPLDRPDVAAALGKPFLKDAGFLVKVPTMLLSPERLADFKFVVVAADGKESELAPTPEYRQTLQQLLRALCLAKPQRNRKG